MCVACGNLRLFFLGMLILFKFCFWFTFYPLCIFTVFHYLLHSHFPSLSFFPLCCSFLYSSLHMFSLSLSFALLFLIHIFPFSHILSLTFLLSCFSFIFYLLNIFSLLHFHSFPFLIFFLFHFPSYSFVSHLYTLTFMFSFSSLSFFSLVSPSYSVSFTLSLSFSLPHFIPCIRHHTVYYLFPNINSSS